MASGRKIKLGLSQFYVIAEYLGLLAVAVNYPRLPKRVWLWPGQTGPRCVIMLWAFVLLALGLRADFMLGLAILKDREEIRQGVRGGGLNAGTLLALATPLMLLLDAGAIAHFYLCWFHSGGQSAAAAAALPTAVMAIGCVLWIYGRRMPALPYRSICGFRTARTMESPEAWQAWHAKAAPAFCVVGIAALLVGTFLPL